MPVMSDPYKVARERVQQRSVADQQQADDAIKRRFTAMGAMNSGAAVKVQQQAQEQVLQKRNEAMADVDAAEQQRNLQVEEAEKQRQFTSREGQLARDFQAGEAEKGRGFHREQAGIDRAFQDKVFQFDSQSKLRMLDQADRDFGLKKEESEWNRRLEEYKIGTSGGFFGGGGFLGLGIDAKPVKI